MIFRVSGRTIDYWIKIASRVAFALMALAIIGVTFFPKPSYPPSVMAGTDCTGADLTSADLSGVDLRRVTFTDAILTNVKTDDDTQWGGIFEAKTISPSLRDDLVEKLNDITGE